MARPNKRARARKRALWVERQVAEVKAKAEARETQRVNFVPYAALSGNARAKQSLTPANLKGMTHTKGCNAFGRGQGGGSKAPGWKRKGASKPQAVWSGGPNGSPEVPMVLVGYTEPRQLVVVDKDTGERKFLRIGPKPVYKVVGEPGTVPNRR